MTTDKSVLVAVKTEDGLVGMKRTSLLTLNKLLAGSAGWVTVEVDQAGEMVEVDPPTGHASFDDPVAEVDEHQDDDESVEDEAPVKKSRARKPKASQSADTTQA